MIIAQQVSFQLMFYTISFDDYPVAQNLTLHNHTPWQSCCKSNTIFRKLPKKILPRTNIGRATESSENCLSKSHQELHKPMTSKAHLPGRPWLLQHTEALETDLAVESPDDIRDLVLVWLHIHLQEPFHGSHEDHGQPMIPL